MGDTVRIGIIGGGGWIGRAVAESLLSAGVCAPSGLTLSSRTGTCTVPGLAGTRWTSDNRALAETSDVVIVSVRPEQYAQACFAAGEALVISLMAGIPIRRIAAQSGSTTVVRAMPNAAVSIRRSFTPWVASATVQPAQRDLVHRIFTTCGQSVALADEAELDAFTALTGAGPALPALLADAMIAQATARGMSPHLARRAVRSVVVDAARLLDEGGTDPAAMVATFLAYRGTTAAGLDAMIRGGFRQIVASGLDRMTEQASLLSNSKDSFSAS